MESSNWLSELPGAMTLVPSAAGSCWPTLPDSSTDRSALILAEVCATRKEVEALLGAISDLNDRDIDRARSDADLLRRALVEERILELKQAKGGPGDA